MEAGKGEKAETVVATNRKAFHDYHIEERYEAGMALQGTEVKAIREGLVNLRDSFARVDGTEVILHNCHISPYSHGNIMNHDPLRPRKLLLHRRQINKLMGRTQQKGLTLVPLRLYFTPAGKAKIEIGLGKGKHEYDRREDIKNRESRREVQRAMKASKR
jgi:SsrA-binding protein